MKRPRAWHVDANHRHYPTGDGGKLDFNASFTRHRNVEGTPKAVLNAVCDRMTRFRPGLLTILPVIKAKDLNRDYLRGLDIFTQRHKERYQLDYAFSEYG